MTWEREAEYNVARIEEMLAAAKTAAADGNLRTFMSKMHNISVHASAAETRAYAVHMQSKGKGP